jgi:ComF family protein
MAGRSAIRQPFEEARNCDTRAHLPALAATRQWLARLFLPTVCVSCAEPIATRDSLCAACWNKIDFIVPPLCDRLGIRLPFSTGDIMISAAAAAQPPLYARARAVAHYEGLMRKLIHDFKFRDRHEIRRLFGTWLCRAGAELIADADVIVPVPLSRLRLLRRRFNQAALLAQEVGRATRLPVRTTGLRRVRRTQRQVGLTREQRQQNVRGAFAVTPREVSRIAGRRVLLVDDIVTTGATVEACTSALLKAGATNVDVLVVAIVSDPLRVTT